MSLFDIENIHRTYLEDLMSRVEDKEKVRELYNKKRGELEESAVVKDFIPILAHKTVKEELKVW